MNWFVTILLSLVPFFWQHDKLQLQLLGYGDFLSPVNVFQEIINRLFMFYPHVGAGSNIAFLTSHIFPFLSWHAAFSLFHISPLIASLAFMSLILLCSQISMEMWMNYIFSFHFKVKNQNRRFFIFCVGKIYAFAPLCIWLIAPGHIYQLILYALFPWILLLVDALLMNSLTKKIVLPKLFFLFLCCAPAFANIGILYVLFVIFFSYVVANWLTKGISAVYAIQVLFLLIVTALLANIWWLLPYLYTIIDTINIANKSDIINLNISGSTGMAYILNIFLGHPENLLYLDSKYKIFLSPFFELGSLVFWILGLITIIQWKRYRYSIVCLFMLITAIFLVKGSQQPFASLFMWFYDHVPGFQIFRRPISKFFWVYWFFLITLAIGSSGVLYERFIKKIKVFSFFIVFFLVLYMCGVIYAFFVTKEQNAFSIPQYYYEAATYLEKNKATRVLLLPDLNGMSTSFNQEFHYEGADFFPALVKSEVFIPDSTNYSADYFSKPIVNQFVAQLRNNQSFCETAAILGVSHIVLRHDLFIELTMQRQVKTLHDHLINSSDINTFRFFNPDIFNQGLSIYDVRKECRRPIIQVSSGIVTSKIIYPGLIIVKVNKSNDNLQFKLLYNYSDLWSAYILSPRSEKHLVFRGAQFILEDVVNLVLKRERKALPHLLVDGYANGWELKSNGVSDVEIIMVYRLQYIFYLGITFFIVLILGWLFSTRRKL